LALKPTFKWTSTRLRASKIAAGQITCI